LTALDIPVPPYHQQLITSFYDFIKVKEFPCIAARAAAMHHQITCKVADDMRSGDADEEILRFFYQFVDDYRASKDIYQSAALLFEGPRDLDEEEFDKVLWRKLQSLTDLDAQHYAYDNRVNKDPQSPHFSFSLKEEAFFIVALHPGSSRMARRFTHPVLVFNPHEQFEILRKNNHFEPMKEVVRRRDHHFSGSINPMLDDFGLHSEASQYSGTVYDKHWKCPLQVRHGEPGDNSAP
jgi:uncharacterized protein